MNDRIKQLIYQATDSPAFPGDVGRFDTEKFAELLIKECAEFINGSQDEDPGEFDCKLAYELKEHFGVNPFEKRSK